MSTYATGYGLALVDWRWAEPPVALDVVFGLGLVQVIVRFRCFLHVELRRQVRDDLLLILFSTLIVCPMVGGTPVVPFELRMRMM